MSTEHQYFMSLALEESKNALPDCLPNPPVGCVLVRDGLVVAYGHTREPGQHHAEMDALKNYSGSLNDTCAYVTLEPCSFHGRTPSCAQSLAKTRIKRIYVAMRDPDPRNNGKGIGILQAGGITVIEDILSEEVNNFLGHYLLMNGKIGS